MSEQDVRDAHKAGEQAAQDRQDHYRSNVMGQGSCAGDPVPDPEQQPAGPDWRGE